ncbi:allantoicase [Engraulis encrasicolus]|uniref:allantoicase n=1 Tax=Engraulis encrasicolus TaxID=184585 RepID=UPI002FD4DD05
MATRIQQKASSALPDFLQFNDLASETAGGRVIFATDEWFAPAHNLLKRDTPEFIASAFTEFGKWMDGWESRRKRIPGHDWCIIELGVPGVVYGVDIDTSFFTGNYSPSASLQAACLERPPALSLKGDRTGMAASEEQLQLAAMLNSEVWEELVPVTQLEPGYSDTCHNYFPVTSSKRVTHVRLNMFPDGGISRLRVYGVGQRDWSLVSPQEQVDLVAVVNGGVCLGYTDAHFGHPRNMIGLGRAPNMGDGWETARRLDRPAVLKMDEQGILQVPGSEWAVFRLGHPGVISNIEIDTNHFKGNFPDSCRLEVCSLTGEEEEQCVSKKWTGEPPGGWRTLLPPQKLQAHHRHMYSGESVVGCGQVSHVRLVIAPDGGVSRLRLWGHITPEPSGQSVIPPKTKSKL